MSSESILNTSDMARLRKWRMLKDSVARVGIGIGGVSVILAIVLIFFFLLAVVIPIFGSAELTGSRSYSVPGGVESRSLYWDLEEQNEVGVRFSGDGSFRFFHAENGETIREGNLPVDGARVTEIAKGLPGSGYVGFGLDDGRMMVARHEYDISYPDDIRKISPKVTYPFGEDAITVSEAGEPLLEVAFQDGEDQATFAALTRSGLEVVSFSKEESMLDESITLEEDARVVLPVTMESAAHLLMDPAQQWLYLVSSTGDAIFYDITNKNQPTLVQQFDLVDGEATLTSLRLLLGGISLIVGDSEGKLSQWFPVRDENNVFAMRHVRTFPSMDAAIRDIAVEPRRKGFVAVDEQGVVAIYHSTSERQVLSEKIGEISLNNVAISPRANAMMVEDVTGTAHFIGVDNEHPEVSWSSLWGKVWYESYEEPEYVWQSSASTNDFEPKFSLVPITFGTLKAAFYAMLIAAPLAIMGAIYTAYFMSWRMRTFVKPTIEIMEALPTVIIGFLAGLWLAPFAEEHLPGLFSLAIITPLGIILTAYGFSRLPRKLRHAIPDGWEAALLLPVIIFFGWLSIALSSPLEHLLFDGDMRHWLTNDMGIPYDQRNSVVVGMAMGFAVIPTIFSIAEDAVFGVPKHLTTGSLALGATPWQTMMKVVILTASPGIFSAVMIGFGRAVGETMIVLMATGNTPVMDFSIFQGMRTLAANIAVEMPESEVDSTHYRVLFLAGLVLFMFTFIFNTSAEVVRQRLRRKYSSL